jgi:hypothetical protein
MPLVCERDTNRIGAWILSSPSAGTSLCPGDRNMIPGHRGGTAEKSNKIRVFSSMRPSLRRAVEREYRAFAEPGARRYSITRDTIHFNDRSTGSQKPGNADSSRNSRTGRLFSPWSNQNIAEADEPQVGAPFVANPKGLGIIAEAVEPVKYTTKSLDFTVKFHYSV